MDLSYCVVNTSGRRYLRACLDAIRAGAPGGLECEILVLDNASDDGSVAEIEAWSADPGFGGPLELIALEWRIGKAEADSLLLERARGELCLLLNEDTELRPGAAPALVAALRTDPDAVAAGARLLDPEGAAQPSAWRLPGLGTAIAGALFVHRLAVVQSRGERTREVGWVQSAAMIVRREAARRVGWLDPWFFVYSDETDLCKRLRDAGGRILWAPAAEAVHHEQLAIDSESRARRVVEFHRGRERYMRKHHSAAVALAVRLLGAWSYGVRAGAATLLSGRNPAPFALHARQALRPWRGEGLREAAAAYNAQREGASER